MILKPAGIREYHENNRRLYINFTISSFFILQIIRILFNRQAYDIFKWIELLAVCRRARYTDIVTGIYIRRNYIDLVCGRRRKYSEY